MVYEELVCGLIFEGKILNGEKNGKSKEYDDGDGS